MQKIVFKPIGVIHTTLKYGERGPIQPRYAKDIEGTIELAPEYIPALKDLDGFSHITLIYFMHKSKDFSLQVVPYLDDKLRGLFSTRAPRRPNPIGLSVVRLIKIEQNILYIKEIDALNGTPLLDIKPFIAEFTNRDEIKMGWIDGKIS